jgi:hypothetical protein
MFAIQGQRGFVSDMSNYAYVTKTEAIEEGVEEGAPPGP